MDSPRLSDRDVPDSSESAYNSIGPQGNDQDEALSDVKSVSLVLSQADSPPNGLASDRGSFGTPARSGLDGDTTSLSQRSVISGSAPGDEEVSR